MLPLPCNTVMNEQSIIEPASQTYTCKPPSKVTRVVGLTVCLASKCVGKSFAEGRVAGVQVWIKSWGLGSSVGHPETHVLDRRFCAFIVQMCKWCYKVSRIVPHRRLPLQASFGLAWWPPVVSHRLTMTCFDSLLFWGRPRAMLLMWLPSSPARVLGFRGLGY